MRKKKLKTAHTELLVSIIVDSRLGNHKHTQHEESKCIVIFRCISTAISLSHPKERRDDNPESKIEEPESAENSVGVGVAEDDFPLSRYHHANACHAEEVADESVGDGHASPSHQRK